MAEKEEMKFEEKDWEEIKKGDISLMLPLVEKKEILEKIGYSIDKKGFLIYSKTGERIKETGDGEEINFEKEPDLALITTRSHNFVKGIVGYSDYLTINNLYKFVKKG